MAEIKKTVTAFTISRAEWLRGEGTLASYLLRSTDDKRCCAGIYARALGVSNEQVRDYSWPNDSRKPKVNRPICWNVTGTEAEWLMNFSNKPGLLSTLSGINDSWQISNHDREIRIAQKFADQGITVTFTD